VDRLKALMPKGKVKEITEQACADMLSEMDVSQSLDLGSALIHLGQHPDLGDVGLFATAFGRAALLVM